MRFEKTDRDPCQGCPQRVTRPNLAPWCQRAAHYGQVGCLRNAAPPSVSWSGQAPERRARREHGR